MAIQAYPTLEKDYSVSYNHIEPNKILKFSSLQDFMQDIAAENAQDCDFGYSFMIKNNLAWFVIKYRLEFIDYPILIDKVKIITRPRGAQKFIANRTFEILNNNRIIGKAFSQWVMVDIDSREIVDVRKVLPDIPDYQQNDEDLKCEKIPSLKKVDKAVELKALYQDLDVNGHVNNTVYINWALESLPYDFRIKHKPKIVDMYFKKEALFGDAILSEVDLDIINKVSVHSLKNKTTNEILCSVMVKFTEIL